MYVVQKKQILVYKIKTTYRFVINIDNKTRNNIYQKKVYMLWKLCKIQSG